MFADPVFIAPPSFCNYFAIINDNYYSIGTNYFNCRKRNLKKGVIF